jgi:two-component system, chemotaxis family, sensor kinase CheA
MSNGIRDDGDVRSLIEKLSVTVKRADPDDLRALAKMHGWCEILAAGNAKDSGSADPQVAARAGAMAKSLEALILGEAPDPQAAFQALVRAVEDLSNPGALLSQADQPDGQTPGTQGSPETSTGQPAVDVAAEPTDPAGKTQIQNLIDQLSATAARIDKDDLQALAQMQGWCEELANSAREDTARGVLAEHACCLADDLAKLLLNEVSDANAAYAAIAEGLHRLSDMITGAYEPNPTARLDLVGSPGAGLGDQEVRAKLDKVFEDACEPGAASATPGPGSPPAETRQTAAPASQSPASGPPTAAAAPSNEPRYQPEPLIVDPKELEFIKAFVEEAGEHIESIEAAVLEVEQQPTNLDKINDLFRPFHTIKGMAGFLHLRDVNCLTHEVETVLDQARKGKRPVTPGLIDLVFTVVDILKVQVAALGNYLADPNGQPVPQPPVVEMIQLLRDVVAGRVEPDAQATPAPGGGGKLGENLVTQGATPRAVVDFALETQKAADKEKKVGEILMDLGAVTAKQVSQAIRAQTPPAETSTAAKAATDQSIRIDTAKLDALVDTVGELVIAQTLVQANGLILTDPRLSKDVDQVTKIIRDVQEVAMGMRMIPIGPTFQKMARLVRDVSRKANRQVNLTFSGEDTELDKNVIQQIGDPLIHMVRNAVDHGIEPPEARTAAGKPPIGQVHLHAGHQGGNIIIEVSDDGKGLDAEVLVAKGIEKGLVQPGEELTEQQAYALIMAPGFSTAKEVTDISGRGVGMDVVKRNIDQLRGKVDIASQKGKGTTFAIRLPLTLAIIDGMIIRLGEERFIIPTIVIEQSLRPQKDQITTVLHQGEVLNVRGRLIPLIQLGQMFGLTPRINPSDTMVVIAHCEETQIGLVVEELIGQQQVVIKTLGQQFERLKGISGAAILGDGRVGLILEMSGLASLHHTRTVASVPRLSASDLNRMEGGPAATDPAEGTTATPAG